MESELAPPPLLVAARELARGALPADTVAVASAFRSARLAVLFRSQTKPNCVQLGVFHATNPQVVDTHGLIPLLSNQDEKGDSEPHDADWALVWSPDGQFLVVSGRIEAVGGALEAVLWIVTRPEWLDPAASSSGPPLLLRVDPASHLPSKQWVSSASIVSAFFPSGNNSKLFLITSDGSWLNMDVQLAKLALMTMNPSASEDTTGFVTFSVAKRLTEWHAGVTASRYEPKSAILVVSGGLRDPSTDLIEKQASSLSVWKVLDSKNSKEVAELLDYTMVLKGKKRQQDSSTTATETTMPSTAEEGALASVKSSLFAPLKMMMGAETTETRVLNGSISHLSIAPNGNYVGMLDGSGRVAIRQIDACAEVLKWQTVEDVAATVEGCTMREIVWLTSELLALVLSEKRVIYTRFVAHSEDGETSGRLSLAAVQHHRPTIPASSSASENMQTLAFATDGSCLDGDAFTAFELLATSAGWVANQLRNLEIDPFVELLMEAQRFDDALATVERYGASDTTKLDADAIHRRVWLQFRDQFAISDTDAFASKPDDLVLLATRSQRGERDDFMKAVEHLRAISNKLWVLDECLRLVAEDSSSNMKKLLDIAWNALTGLNDGSGITDELAEKQQRLQQYIYRFETFRRTLTDEDNVTLDLFDGGAYALFRSTCILMTAKQLAREGRVNALVILFQRHAWNLLPHRFEILELLPCSIPPTQYAPLLPAIAAQVDDDDQLYTLSSPDTHVTGAEDTDAVVTAVTLLSENRDQDLTPEELAECEAYMRQSREERGVVYTAWYTRRILELDALYGQLGSAYDLSRLAMKCLSGWTAREAKQPFDEFLQHTERLYTCVYPLQLSGCCLLPLSEWSTLSMQEQALLVIGKDPKELEDDRNAIIDRLSSVFISQRRDLYTLDGLIAGLALRLLVENPSLSSLALSAQLIHHSNPSIARTNRWIQSDERLIKTALDVVYSVDITEILGSKQLSEDEDLYIQRHLILVEQLWVIFQSLPVRKEEDPPEIAQLQVAVDEMEDLMVTMDVLSKYGVVTSPSGLKYSMLASTSGGNGVGTSVGPHALLEQMCSFALTGGNSADSEEDDGSQWLVVLQDAIKLKQHAFGERLSQETILDVILKHLLASDGAFLDAAQDLVDHWLNSNVEAVDHVLDVLISTIQTKLDAVTGYSEDAEATATHDSASRCIAIARHLLALSVWEEGERAASGVKQHYEDVLRLEMDTANACELLDLLTYGAIKLSPARLRSPEGNEDDGEGSNHLDTVCQVFVSNPSNYKPSIRAREWLEQHQPDAKTEDWNEPLAAVMRLAKLLRVDHAKLEIRMKGAYAALYCMDYDVAFDLTMHVIDGLPADSAPVSVGSSSDGVTLLHLVSLVLDLVSASSFRSYTKKSKLCRALFSSAAASSTDLFAHQVTDLVLAWLTKIDAIQALMSELGLSETDLEQRQLQGGKQLGNSVELVLLQELEVVIELLKEEKKDRQFLLRLLQRGFQLLEVLANSEGGTDEGCNARTKTFLQQMIQLCIQEAVELATNEEPEDWQQYLELGFSYLLLWNDVCQDDEVFAAFCKDRVLPLLFDSADGEAGPTNEVVTRRCHHFFLLQVASAVEDADPDEVTALSARRQRFNVLSASYEAARRVVSSSSDSEGGELLHNSVEKPQRDQIYRELARECQERLVSQQQSQELEQMSTFFNSELDLERFSMDSGYRKAKILLLATRKEHFQVARQFAAKYELDDYDCVLAYIRHALLSPSTSHGMSRHDQLESAFRSEQVDFLDEALQRPFAFGDFLLKGEAAAAPSLYEALDGTDHVGILLVLRMVLECSKRIYQQSGEAPHSSEASLFPLPKPSSDRVTLLFMCLKKLKDVGDSLPVENEPVDLKLVGAATSTEELLTPVSHTDAQALTTKRQQAVEAVRPLLSGKTIKVVTKILRKLHRVTPSAMVLIYLNDLLTGIWREHGGKGSSSALSADLAVYAYEACVPCLSVLSNEHLLLFHHLFLDGSSRKPLPELVAHLDLFEELYGQQVDGLRRFGDLLTPEKRVELVADTLTLFQNKYNSWQTSGPRSNVSSASSTSSISSVSWDPTQFKRKEQELRYLERELAESVCCWVLREIQQLNLLFLSGTESLEAATSALQTWFAMDPLQQAASQDEALLKNVLFQLCERIASVELTTLLAELVLRAGGSKASSEDAEAAIAQSYQAAVTVLLEGALGQGDGGGRRTPQWMERLVWTWVDVPSTTSTSSDVAVGRQVGELGRYLRIALDVSEQGSSESHALYGRVVTSLAQSPSPILKEIAGRRLSAIQSPSDESPTLVHDAVLTQWQRFIADREDRKEWVEAAALSHVLTASSDLDEAVEAAKWHFGLHVKAVWTALLTKHRLEKSTELPGVLEVSSRDVFAQFDTLFEELLSFVEARARSGSPKLLRFAEQATVALGNLLVRRDGLQRSPDAVTLDGASAWRAEQTRAVQTRAQAQFQLEVSTDRRQSVSKAEDTANWTALFSRGSWGTRLLDWYLTLAYDKLRNDEGVMEAAVLAHWEAGSMEMALQLLLMCPFDALRAKHESRVLSSVQQLPRTSRYWSTIMKLSLLRFDVAVLLQHGLHDAIVAFLLQQESSEAAGRALWTSSGDYVVCAMVIKGEFAAAGRLTCALRHAHPLLWDLENARLLVANYLRALAAVPHCEWHDVYAHTASHFARAIM
ncbi:hypothetical protein BBJ28_00015940 [Nothophytophthora sp. Chile5]|nr:hypothetical protein BBJ28_00015940 [Nothophytophthora sp. Chile5]